MLRLPYSIIPANKLRKFSHLFLGISGHLGDFFPFLKLSLKRAEIDIDAREYISLCMISSIIFFLFFGFIISMVFIFLGLEKFFFGFLIAIFLSVFVFLQQVLHPKIIANKKIRDIERNLLPAMQNMLIQLNSGVPLFDILVSISKEDYGGVSEQFNKAVKEINAGTPQIDALEEIASLNPSVLFRRAIWQIVNGMKSGADMARVIKEVNNTISDEQVLQIQRYGSQLNPLAMFYMLVAVIMPSLGMTFLILT